MKLSDTLLLLSSINLIMLANICQGAKDIEITMDIVKKLRPEAIQCLLKRGRQVQDRLGPRTRADELSLLDNFSLKLLQWVNATFRNASRPGLSFFTMICFPKGCINIGDAGIHP